MIKAVRFPLGCSDGRTASVLFSRGLIFSIFCFYGGKAAD